ncbi:hypothetical protein JX266_008467 [Neoarthrinium moseri]|nr:hypothetical protein JX266_008467 [Neoarthrinium moseri]
MAKVPRSLGARAAAVVAALAFSAPILYHCLSSTTLAFDHFESAKRAILAAVPGRVSPSEQPAPFQCRPHAYTTELVSLDPLVIYIDSFLAPAEITALLAAGEAEFAPSEVVKRGHEQRTADRTSQSAGLPADDAAVRCVLGRAEAFMGTLLDGRRGEIGPPQLVRYTAGQRFNVHHDWYDRPQPARRDKRRLGRSWNRVASFFAVLQDGCTGGATHFPYVKARARAPAGISGAQSNGTWYEHEGGGIAFRPVRGNAVFWVNLHANGTGDQRVMHAGLPLEGGLKTAMNIWPRQYYE